MSCYKILAEMHSWPCVARPGVLVQSCKTLVGWCALCSADDLMRVTSHDYMGTVDMCMPCALPSWLASHARPIKALVLSFPKLNPAARLSQIIVLMSVRSLARCNPSTTPIRILPKRCSTAQRLDTITDGHGRTRTLSLQVLALRRARTRARK